MSFSNMLQHRFVVRGILVAITAVVVSTTVGSWVRSRQEASRCVENLRMIYSALVEYQQQAQHLPELAFFPNDAQLDPDSLYAELSPFGVQPSHCLCPSAPPALRGTGMTYVWNIALNGIDLGDLTEPTWMLTEVHALSDSVRPPHRKSYNVLYTDGSVRRSRPPPAMP